MNPTIKEALYLNMLQEVWHDQLLDLKKDSFIYYYIYFADIRDLKSTSWGWLQHYS